MNRPARVIRKAGGMLALLAVCAVGTGWLGLRASLPLIDGTYPMSALHGRLTVDRDAAGVPTITALDRHDLALGLGFIHGQDRFFQMDLLRRAAAGEMSALLGPQLLPLDRRLRPHRFRHVSRAVIAALMPKERELLDAYVVGVNAGLASLRSRPFEYWLLRGRPEPWTAEDSILCVYAMYLELQDGQGHAQLQRGLLREVLPEAAWRFLEAGTPEWDAAVDGSHVAAPRVPLAAEYDLRHRNDLPALPPGPPTQTLNMLGSNNWAAGGTRTNHGAAIVANDMHLDFRVPNIWYRARLVQAAAAGATDVTGVTLPGTPCTIAGSNGSIAWGFTNSYGEFAKVVRLVPVAGKVTEYATATGTHRLRELDESIDVAHGRTEHLTVSQTEWGPVLGKDWVGQLYALQWTAHDAGATNLNLLNLEHAHSVDEALRLAADFGMPGQNLIVGDAEGHIGWTIAGRLPRRDNVVARVPVLSTDATVGFDGWLPPQDQPRVTDPPSGFLWSANARVVGGRAATLVGDDGMDRGARAHQIQADLMASRPPFTADSSLAIQLDARAVFLERWKTLLEDLLRRAQTTSNAHTPALAVLQEWSGHAAPDDAAYRLVNEFREQVATRVFLMLTAPARVADPDFDLRLPSSFEGPLWLLLQEKPPHLLDSRYADWDELLLTAVTAAEKLPSRCQELRTCTWGTVNAVQVSHPLSAAIPWLAPLLDMPTAVVAGGRADMPRVQGPDFGASERFSVAPGHEAYGYFHMPGAQSGHPLSPFYRTGFDAWAQGLATPFLPGATTHSLILRP